MLMLEEDEDSNDEHKAEGVSPTGKVTSAKELLLEGVEESSVGIKCGFREGIPDT